MYELLIIILLITEVWHDVYRERYMEKVIGYNFIRDRKAKLIKFAGICLACFIVWLLTNSLYFALFPLGARVILFDQLISLFRYGKLLTPLEWFKRSEVYYWILILNGTAGKDG